MEAAEREAEAAGRGEDENRPSPESEDSLDEEVDDVELALALGVPSNCVEKMSPRKVAVPDSSMEGQEVHPKEPSHTSGIAQPELSAAELRDLRIQELTFPDLIQISLSKDICSWLIAQPLVACRLVAHM